MRHVLIITVLLAACLAASSSPIDLSRKMVNWPAANLESRASARIKRSGADFMGRPSGIKIRTLPALAPRKGEYICGDRICKLRPGDKPPCEHCQYPI